MTNSRCSKRSSDRAGYVLVLFLMIVFGIMGLAALVIDLGYARLAQRQMQSATDTAALEGVRFSSDCPDEWLTDPAFGGNAPAKPTTPFDPTDASWQAWMKWLDGARRTAASQITAKVFDDDLDPSDGDPRQFGAGPIIDTTGGVGSSDIAAGQLISLPTTSAYKPTQSDGTPGLELNSSNNAAGDVATGSYGLNSNFQNSASAESASDEDSQYVRRDFSAADSAGAPAASAFLARMRRTNNFGSLDATGGVSSAGPTLPFLWGRGSLITTKPGQPSSPRRDGIGVRATSIAAADDGVTFDSTAYSVGRAKAAGPPFASADPNNSALRIRIPGITPFALTQSFWEGNGWTTDTPSTTQSHVTLQVLTAGTIVAAGPPQGVTPLGQTMTPVLTEIGQPVVSAGAVAPITAASSEPEIYRYVPIYQTTSIIGFGYVSWSLNAANNEITLTRGGAGAKPVGRGNISGVLILGLPRDAGGNLSVDANQLFTANAALQNPVFAPVLVNRYIGPNH